MSSFTLRPMPEIDDELIARAMRWCADAGRTCSPQQLREALAPLSWDELLAARALLADPPPARPLGPRALAELARGTSPAEAAARERSGDYGAAGEALPAPPAAVEPRPRPGAPRRGRRAAAPVVRRARDRVPAPAPAAPTWPDLDELRASEGRAVLERLIRERGARRAPIVAALVAGWRRADGSVPDAGDLSELLDAHGLTRGFARRERDELLHALRAAGGVRQLAAAAVALSPEELDAALLRLGARDEAGRIRAAHREELRRRELLSDRARLVLSDAERLADLGLLAEFEQDLRARLPEHVRALRSSSSGPLSADLAWSLSLATGEAERLATRLGVDLDLAASAHGAPGTARRSPPPSRGGRGIPPRFSSVRSGTGADRRSSSQRSGTGAARSSPRSGPAHDRRSSPRSGPAHDRRSSPPRSGPATARRSSSPRSGAASARRPASPRSGGPPRGPAPARGGPRRPRSR